MKEINLEHPNHNEYTPNNIESGKIGERFGIHLDAKHMKLGLNHNDLDNDYTNQKGPDFWDEEGLIVGDAKNYSDSYYLNMDWAIELDEKPWAKDAKIKFVLASIINSWQVRNYLRKQGWFIIEWGEKLTGQSWKPAIAKIFKQKDFYELLKAIKQERILWEEEKQKAVKREWLLQEREKKKEIRNNWVKPKTTIKNNNSVSSFVKYWSTRLSEYVQDSVVDDSKVVNTRYKDNN